MLQVDAVSTDLIQRVCAGDVTAWRSFAAIVFPELLRCARSHRRMAARRLDSEDHARELMLRAVERLRKNDFHNLKSFLAQQTMFSGVAAVRAPGFGVWLNKLLNFAVAAYLTEIYGEAPEREAGGVDAGSPSVAAFGDRGLAKRDLHTLAERLAQDSELGSFHPHATTQHTASEILRYVLGAFSSRESLALLMYILHGRSYAEIAHELSLPDAGAAERLIRALKQRLRQQFDEPTHTTPAQPAP